MRVAADVGGTFIDVIGIDDETGEVYSEKQAATPDRLAAEVLAAVGRLPGGVRAVTELLHGSTIAINALVQGRGARTGLITTAGFRDVLELGRGNRPFIYDWVWNPPPPLVPRSRRREVHERLGSGGEVLRPLDRDELLREADVLVADGVESLVIAFLHAYADPKHERLAAASLAERYPDLPVTISSDVAAEWREFERTSTAVINGHLQPIFGRYIDELAGELDAVDATLSIMASNGGLMPARRAVSLPVRTLASGPAGGVIGCASIAAALGHSNVICADVGGTTFDVSIIEDGTVQERSLSEIGGRPVLGPSLEVVSVGAGGGSVAWIDETDGLRVGPVSAGARPGPACFGFGGTEPTVTDAHLVLGLLDPDGFLGGRMQLDPEAATTAIRDRIAEPLGMEVTAAAAGIATIAQTTMAAAIHAVTVERGSDPRDFVMYAFGGGGGLFAAPIAADLAVPTVVVPGGASTLSAWGIAGAAFREDASVTRVVALDEAGIATAHEQAELLELEMGGRTGAGRSPTIERSADIRYVGQEHTVTVRLHADDDAAALASRFTKRHQRMYGHGDPEASAEIVTIRVVSTTERPWIQPKAWPVTEECAPRTERDAWLPPQGRWVATPIYERARLAVGQRVAGPAIVEEPTSTTLVPAGWTSEMHAEGHLILRDGNER